MRLRNLITTLLLLFAGASLAYVAAGGHGPHALPAAIPSGAATTAAMATDAAQLLPHPARVTVYYFHATARCQTCRAIEANADEALRAAFGEQLADGTLAWRSLNVEAPENRHFIDDFQLTSRDIVVVRRRPDGSREWHRLDRTWALAHDKAAFVHYVKGEVGAALNLDSAILRHSAADSGPSAALASPISCSPYLKYACAEIGSPPCRRTCLNALGARRIAESRLQKVAG